MAVAGAADPRRPRGGRGRPAARPGPGVAGPGGLAGGAVFRLVDRRGRAERRHLGHRRRAAGPLGRAGGRGGGRHRQPRRGDPPRALLLQARQARGDGERGGRRAGGAAPGAPRRRGRHRLLAGLRGPARPHLRDGGLGARRGLRGGRRREGHPVPAGLPPLHSRDRLGSLRVHARSRWRGATSIPGCSTRSWTAPSRPSRWRRCPTPRGSRRPRRGSSSLPAAWTTWPACSVRARRGARSTTPARSR